MDNVKELDLSYINLTTQDIRDMEEDPDFIKESSKEELEEELVFQTEEKKIIKGITQPRKQTKSAVDTKEMLEEYVIRCGSYTKPVKRYTSKELKQSVALFQERVKSDVEVFKRIEIKEFEYQLVLIDIKDL